MIVRELDTWTQLWQQDVRQQGSAFLGGSIGSLQAADEPESARERRPIGFRPPEPEEPPPSPDWMLLP